MKLPAFITSLLGSISSGLSGATGDIVFVIPNERGGFSLCPETDTESYGNYATAEDAMRVVRKTGGTPKLKFDNDGHSRGALKFVVMREMNGTERLVFCAQPTTHFELAQVFHRSTGGRPISAGFVEFKPDGTARAYGRSESLQLEPREEDGRLLAGLYRITSLSAPDRKAFIPPHALTHQSAHA